MAPQEGGYGLVDYCGFGFCLIDCRIFKRLSTPFFVYERADNVLSIKLDDDDKMVEVLTSLKARRKLGWKATVGFDELVEDMVKSDLAYFSSKSGKINEAGHACELL